MIAEKSPVGLAALEAVVVEVVRADDSQFEIVDEHLTAIEQQKLEDVDLIVSIPGIIAVDGK